MVIVRTEEVQDFLVTMDLVAVVTMQASVNTLHDMKEANCSDDDIIKSSKEVGKAVGQVVLDAVIETTKDLDRDAMIRYMAQALATLSVVQINNDPEYRDKITTIAKSL